MEVIKLKLDVTEIGLDALIPHQTKSNPGQETIEGQARRLLLDIKELVTPTLLYEFCQPCFDERGLVLTFDGKKLAFSPEDGLSDLKAADEVFVGLATIGPAIEEKIEIYNSRNELLVSYILSELSVAVMGQVIKKIKNLLLDIARQRGYGVSLVHIPGSTPGLPLSLQPLIVEGLNGRAYGITVNEHDIIKPFYSVTFMVGMGSNYARDELLPKCPGCSRKDSCAWRNK